MRRKWEVAALAKRIRHLCRKRFAALRCSHFRQHHLIKLFGKGYYSLEDEIDKLLIRVDFRDWALVSMSLR